jgi:hypothetical protein
LDAALLAAFAIQATGSVKLQVTGNPPTTSVSGFLVEQAPIPSGTRPAAAFNSERLRTNVSLTTGCAFIV